MAQFLHGIQVQEIDSGTRVIRTAKSSVIGLIGTAPNSKIPLNTPTLIKSKKEAEALGNEGTLVDSINGIFDQIGATVVVVRVEDAKLEIGLKTELKAESEPKLDKKIIDGSFEADVQAVIKDLEAFLAAESIVHVKPRILIAPYFSSKKEVLTEMIKVAEKLKAVIIADLGSAYDSPSASDQETINYAKEFGSSRVYIVDPWVKVGEKVLPPSPYVAGLIAKSDEEFGFWRSPSNQEILGITGLSRPIDFSFGDSSCSANFLNENNVATIIHQNGYRLWGNRSCSSDAKWSF